MTTVEFAALVGVTPRTIRAWVAAGVLQPPKRGTRGGGKGGRRNTWSEAHLDRALAVRRLTSEGVAFRDIPKAPGFP